MQCPCCRKEFRDRYALNRHQSRKTLCAPIIETPLRVAKPHACRYCGREFTSKPSMARHTRQYCKIANTDEGMTLLMERTLHRQMDDLQEQVGRLTDLVERKLVMEPPRLIAVMNQIDVRTTNIQVNIIGFDREDRIHIPTALVKAAFTENPRLIEYCRMSDDDRIDAERAAPYVLEALVDLVRRAHQDPVYRNVYLNPKRTDQVIVCLDEHSSRLISPQRWEVRPLMEAIRLLFDGVANNLHRIVITNQERSQLPFDIQNAASWMPNLYEGGAERFVKDGRVPMAAHLANTRPELNLGI